MPKNSSSIKLAKLIKSRIETGSNGKDKINYKNEFDDNEFDDNEVDVNKFDNNKVGDDESIKRKNFQKTFKSEKIVNFIVLSFFISGTMLVV